MDANAFFFKGIEPALSTVWPKVGRRYCCKHLAKNWKNAFGGPLMYSLFWRAASATSPFTFRKAMEKIQKANPEARIWLANLGDQERWTRHKFDPKICSEENKSNFVESFNATLGIDRCRPVLTLLEGVRRMCMVRMSTRRKKCAKWPDNEPCPNIITRIQKLVSDSRACKAYESGPGEYEISDGRSMLPVSLNNRTCICGLWQISGIPCKHAMRAILFAQQDPHKYTSTWYYGVVYKQAYCHTINSIPDHDNWPEIDMPSLHPPPLKRGVGRPARNRKREAGEVEKGKRSTTSRCTNCGEWGHNIRTCKGGLTAKQKKEQAQAKAQADNEATLPKQGKKRKVPTSSSQPSTSTTQQKGKKHLVEACSSSQPLPSAQSSQQGCKSKDPCSSSQPIRRSLRLQNSS